MAKERLVCLPSNCLPINIQTVSGVLYRHKKRILLAGLTTALVALTTQMLFLDFVQSTGPVYFKILLGLAATYYNLSPEALLSLAQIFQVIHSLIIGFGMALLYCLFGASFFGNFIQKGISFGLFLWLIFIIPVSFFFYSETIHSLDIITMKIISSFVFMIISGVLIALIIDLENDS